MPLTKSSGTKLSIYQTNASSAMVAWKWPSIGFVLRANTDLGTTNWAVVTNAITLVNGTNLVVISPLTNHLFFRLSDP